MAERARRGPYKGRALRSAEEEYARALGWHQILPAELHICRAERIIEMELAEEKAERQSPRQQPLRRPTTPPYCGDTSPATIVLMPRASVRTWRQALQPEGSTETRQARLPRPHPAQATVIREAARYNVVTCGRRFGKTTLGINWACQPRLSALSPS